MPPTPGIWEWSAARGRLCGESHNGHSAAVARSSSRPTLSPPLYRPPTDQLVERLGGPTTQLRVPGQCPNFFLLIAPHQNLANVNGRRLLNFLSSQPHIPSTTFIFCCSGSHLIHHGRTYPRQAIRHVCRSVSLVPLPLLLASSSPLLVVWSLFVPASIANYPTFVQHAAEHSPKQRSHFLPRPAAGRL